MNTPLRARIVDALEDVEVLGGIRSRIPYGRLADAVLAIGEFDVVLDDGQHVCHPRKDHDRDVT